MVKFVPISSVANYHINGVGAVEVGERYIYIPTDLMAQFTKAMAQSMDLQAKVKRFREFLLVRYGKNDELPPFDPESLRMATIVAGSHNLFGFTLNGITSEDTSLERQVLNEKRL